MGGRQPLHRGCSCTVLTRGLTRKGCSREGRKVQCTVLRGGCGLTSCGLGWTLAAVVLESSERSFHPILFPRPPCRTRLSIESQMTQPAAPRVL